MNDSHVLPERPAPACQSEPGIILMVRDPVPYSTAWELQSRLHHERLHGLRPDTILILEHNPVYTLGRSTQPAHWGGSEASLRSNGCELYHANRGGSVTYHGPGQVVVYPILRLVQYATGPRRFVWLLEETILRLLRRWAIHGQRVAKKPGVWATGPEWAKIASIGVRIERGVTLHGFALNVDLDLAPFQRIRPCGLEGCRATSMSALAHTAVHVDDVKRELADVLTNVLPAQWSIAEEHSLLDERAFSVTCPPC